MEVGVEGWAGGSREEEDGGCRREEREHEQDPASSARHRRIAPTSALGRNRVAIDRLCILRDV